MTTVPVKDGQTGLVTQEPLEEQLLYKVTNLKVMTEQPENYNHMVMIPDETGTTQQPTIGLMTKDMVIADAIEAVNAARADLVQQYADMDTSLQSQITALQEHDVILDSHDAQLTAHDTAIDTMLDNKQDKFTGTTSQYVRGNGSLAAMPIIPDISGKSDKSSFAALSALAAHGRPNAATNAPVDSKTDYNVLTTLLGTLVDGLNTTNTKQNQIASNLNALALNFNALLTWLGLSKDAINNLRTAGAA